ncbi:unnamed protein product [Linum tenue]|uniref:ADP-ribosyl cyclase/cyclic ADP-ribose hydrolase n=1 Tax=Linum tenue TaxID=586396 RepID=A0AAV0RIU3_9ROSI|nr:unnamed protein product [Linum tenue]
MASPSIEPPPPPWIYQVFLSFRGGDTRNNFVDHLYKELTIKGVYAFRDDSKLERGSSIAPALFQAIEDSRAAIVVLSPNYASSDWCLDELVKILECRESLGRMVVPVFHNVDPSDVEKLSGSFGLGFSELRERLTEVEKKVKRWKEALSEVATISGWDSRYREEAAFIEQIVRDISDKVMCAPSSDAGELVGMGSRLEEIDELLQLDTNIVRMVGIWGLSGIGKTTAARVMFDRHSRQFEASCFLTNVADKFRLHGESALQHELLSKTLLERDLRTWPLGKGCNLIKERLSQRKVLLVFDDVDDLQQVELLANKLNWFGPGSRIIVISQDKQLLEAHGVNVIYEAKCLEDDEALQLFSHYAFHQNQPKKDYWELSHGFVYYASGLPLALKVLGSFLYNKSTCQWQNELNKLEKFPNRKIQDVLKMSYDGLEELDKKVFLDLACFFNGENVDEVRDILDACGFFPERAFGVLIDNAIVTISNGKLYMHGLLQQLGREIVREEAEENGKRSRLWKPDDVYYQLGYLKLINLSHSNLTKIPDLSAAQKLEILNLQDCTSLVELSSIQFLTKLKSLNLKGCKSLGTVPNVVGLKLLETLDLSDCSQLGTLPELPRNLKYLYVGGTAIEELPSSLGGLAFLVILDVKNCTRLQQIPISSKLNSLESLDISGCPHLLKRLSGNGNGELPESVGCCSSCMSHMDIDTENTTCFQGTSGKRDRSSPPTCAHITKKMEENEEVTFPAQVAPQRKLFKLIKEAKTNSTCNGGVPQMSERRTSTASDRLKAYARNGFEKYFANAQLLPKLTEAELVKKLDEIQTSIKLPLEHEQPNGFRHIEYETDVLFHISDTVRTAIPYGEPELFQVSVTPASISTNGTIASKLQISFSSKTSKASCMKGSAISSQSFSSLQVSSRNLLQKLSTRGCGDQTEKSAYPKLNGKIIQGSKLDSNGLNNIHHYRQILAEYMTMSVEAIHQANAFDTIERTTYALIQHSTDEPAEKTELENLLTILAKFKTTIPGTMITMKMAHAKRTSHPIKTTMVDARLVLGQEKLSWLESRSRVVTEEEERIDADIRRLMARKKKLAERKGRIAVQLERTAEKVMKDLGKVERLEEEIKEADEKWVEGKESLDAANASWRAMRERLKL